MNLSLQPFLHVLKRARGVQGKPLTVLHIFHHSVVVVMAWLWLDQAQSLQQLALLTNTGVHVIMYYYYYRCALGKPPRWKRLVTNIQILQFVSRSCLKNHCLLHLSLNPPRTCSCRPPFCVHVQAHGARAHNPVEGRIFQLIR